MKTTLHNTQSSAVDLLTRLMGHALLNDDEIIPVRCLLNDDEIIPVR